MYGGVSSEGKGKRYIYKAILPSFSYPSSLVLQTNFTSILQQPISNHSSKWISSRKVKRCLTRLVDQAIPKVKLQSMVKLPIPVPTMLELRIMVIRVCYFFLFLSSSHSISTNPSPTSSPKRSLSNDPSPTIHLQRILSYDPFPTTYLIHTSNLFPKIPISISNHQTKPIPNTT